MAQRLLMGLTMRYCHRARTPMQSRIRRLGREQGASLSLTVKPHLWKPAWQGRKRLQCRWLPGSCAPQYQHPEKRDLYLDNNVFVSAAFARLC
jgi:hypothetical protein